MAEEKTNQEVTFKDALDVLDVLNDQIFVEEIWVPSLQRTIKIKQLVAKQQKKLLEAAIDSAEKYKSLFSKTFYEILLDNCLEPVDIINNLTYIDKDFIALGLRKTIEANLEIVNTEHSVDLTTLTEKFSSYEHPTSTPLTVEKNNVIIDLVLTPPTLHQEMQFLQKTPDFNLKNKDTSAFKTLVTEMYLYEITKYITQIRINQKDLNYKDYNLNQKYQLIEKLSGVVVQKVLDVVLKWKEDFSKYFQVVLPDGKQHTIEVDASLFLSN